MEAPTRARGGSLRRWLGNRWIRLPFLFALGLGAAALVAAWVTPSWLELCGGWTERSEPCSPITQTTLTGYLTIGLGVFMMVLGPVIASLIDLKINGYDWESSRLETAVSNIPIAVGFAYLVLGFVIAANG